MGKHYSRICETSCFAKGWFAITQQAVAQLACTQFQVELWNICIDDIEMRQQLVAQKVWT